MTYQPSSETCYKRSACVPAQFDHGGGYDVYVKQAPPYADVINAPPLEQPKREAQRAALAKAAASAGHFIYSRAAASYGVKRTRTTPNATARAPEAEVPVRA